MSFNEMCAFLRYFGYDVYEMIDIKLDDPENLMLEFTSPYNYNPSSLNISLDSKEPAKVDKVAAAGEKTLPAAGNPIAVVLLALLALGIGGLRRRL